MFNTIYSVALTPSQEYREWPLSAMCERFHIYSSFSCGASSFCEFISYHRLLLYRRAELIPCPRVWGHTAIYAYRTYQDKTFLTLAQSVWQTASPWWISQDYTNAGLHPLKDGNFGAMCNGGMWCLPLRRKLYWSALVAPNSIRGWRNFQRDYISVFSICLG